MEFLTYLNQIIVVRYMDYYGEYVWMLTEMDTYIT
jgi:hypothetical protein